MVPQITLSEKPDEMTFSAVQQLTDIINSLPQRDYAAGMSNSSTIVISLSEENGIIDILQPEPFAIAKSLIELRVGPRTAHYAWRLYRSYRNLGDWGLNRITY
jgi:hypothetical protein